MTEPTHTNADDRTPEDEHRVAKRPSELTAVVVERDLKADECTLYPRGATDEDLMTRWITAEEGSYVDLESMR